MKGYMEECENFYSAAGWGGEEKEPACRVFNLNGHKCCSDCKEYTPKLKVGQVWYVQIEVDDESFIEKRKIKEITKKTVVLCEPLDLLATYGRKLITDVKFIEYIKG